MLADSTLHGMLSSATYSCQVVLTLSNHIDLPHRKVIEAPICLVDSDSQRSVMLMEVILGQTSNRDTVILFLDDIPQFGDAHIEADATKARTPSVLCRR